MNDDIVKRLRAGALSGDLPLGAAMNWNEVADEIERLRQWKTQATDILDRWLIVHAAMGHPGELGQLQPAAALAEVKRLQAEIERLRAVVRWMADCGAQGTVDEMYGYGCGCCIEAVNPPDHLADVLARAMQEQP